MEPWCSLLQEGRDNDASIIEQILQSRYSKSKNESWKHSDLRRYCRIGIPMEEHAV
jgi:hypothetical protein